VTVGVALHGNLKDFGIAEVFQLIGQQRKTGLLEISGESQRVQLAFDEGRVVWAAPVGRSEFAVLGDRLVRCGLITRARLEDALRESEASARPLPALLVQSSAVAKQDLEEISELLSRETIFEVMRWTGGSFHFTAKAIHHDVPPDKLLGAEQILMDGLRMLDEWQTFQSAVPDEEMVFRRIGRLDVYRHQVKEGGRAHSPAMDRVFQLVDGRLPVRRVIDLSRLGTFEATRLLAELRQAKLIEPLEGRGRTSARRSPVRMGVPIASLLKAVAASLVPLGLLAAVAVVALRAVPEDRALRGAPILHRPLADASDRFARRRIENALEAARYRSGRAPASATDPDAWQSVERLSMAPAGAADYYFARREGDIVLLAPAR
jgi:hypothetical protein